MQKTKKRSYSIAEKLLQIRRYESGLPICELSEESGVCPTVLRQWVRDYNAYGIDGLSMKNAPYSASLKIEIALKVIRNRLSLHQASIDYRISRSVIRQWVKKAQWQGVEVLFINNRGRPPKSTMNKKTERISMPLSREQELLTENERLKAENAYLKKLRALVEERIFRESGNAPTPSRD
jgi:transposase